MDTFILVCVVVGVLVLIVTKVVTSGSSIRAGRVRRQVRATPLVRIADAVDGTRVKIKGEAKADGEVAGAPLSGRDALYWEVQSTRYDQEGMLEPRTRRGGGDFLVQDESGTALVRTTGAAVAIKRDHEETFAATDAPDLLFEILEAAGNRFDRTVGKLVGEEGVVEEGETVAVVGVVSSENTGETRRVVISADPKLGLLLTDDPAALAELPAREGS